MYQSLYRKYRPNNFDEVVGQEIIVKTLKNAIVRNKLNHAYLFTGPRGTGKTSIAKILAKTINCENLKNCIPCNECVSCTQINNRQTIDIVEIDAASNNGVDEIREIRNKVNLVPSVGRYKVYIIDEVHMLTTGAFNALLKTLEEPPAHIIFILATTEPHKIPMTILSRCQRFDFKKINQEKMKIKLNEILIKEKIKTTENVIAEVTRLSDGCMRDALSILDQVIAYADDEITIEDVHEINGTIGPEEISEFINLLLECDYQNVFDMIQNFDNNGKNFIKLTEEIILFLRNILLQINIPKYFENVTDIYKILSEKMNENQIINYIEELNKSIVDMKKSNNARIIFEMIVIKLMKNNSKSESIVLSNNDYINKIIEIDNVNKNEKKMSNKENNDEKINEIQPKKTSDNIDNLIKIRVNNTLCNFNKKELIDFKNNIDNIRLLIIDPEYSEYASIVVDGDVRAVGGENIIFVYDNKRNSDDFNEKCYEIDDMLTSYFKKTYKAIAVDKKQWNKIKEEFNSKTKKYKYIEENNNLKLEQNNEQQEKIELESLFNEIVEYK